MRSKQEIELRKLEALRKRKARLKRNDNRPICWCNVYKFPHKIGGKCKGQEFTQFYFNYQRQLCHECNCLNENSCDVVDGRESIKHAECYIDRVHCNPSEKLPLTFHDLDYRTS